MSVSPENRDLASLSSDEQLARWVEAVQAQAAARHIGRRNRLLTTCDRILDMLKSRTDGTARVLQPLLAHPDPEVRLSAAMKYREVDRDAFLAVASELAKRRDKVGEGARGSLRWDERIKDKPDAPPKCVVPHESCFAGPDRRCRRASRFTRSLGDCARHFPPVSWPRGF
jgi:uncharacterized protein DUF2019